MLSPGTRLIILHDDNKPWRKKGDAISHGYITVRLRSKPNHRFIDANPTFPKDGIFDIESDAVTRLRPRKDLIKVQ